MAEDEKTLAERLRWSLMRRSGVAVCLMLETMGWRPKTVYHIGVGQNSQELDVMAAAWGAGSFQLVGFEPHPEVVQQLQDKYPGTLHAMAVGDRDGTTTLWSKKRHKDGSSLLPFGPEMQDVRSYEVRVTTLDTFFPQGPGPDALLWIDAEGSENAVLWGGQEFIKKVSAINLEMTGRPPCGGWPGTLAVHDMLAHHGFVRQWVHTSRFTAGQYDALYVRKDIFRADLCSCPCAIAATQKGTA